MSIEHGEKVKMQISKVNFIRDDGGMKLPPGFRFQPTDQEMVFQYLIRKVFLCPLPASVVPEILNICNFNPWDLPGDWKQDRYFFSKNGGGHRASDDGYWKATGLEKQITRCCRKKEMITGMKRTLVFYKGKGKRWRSYWIMHEYRLVHSPCYPSLHHHQRCWIQMGNWVLCHIFMNKRSRRVGVAGGKPQLHGSMINVKDGTSSSSSSCGSSEVTYEVSSIRKSSDHQE